MTRTLAVRRVLVSALVVALLVAVGGNVAGARDRSKAGPICAVLKTALNGGTNLGQSLSADQVFAGRQQTAADLSYYAKKGPAPIRSSLKPLANAYKQLVALGRPIDDQVDPTGADTQRAAISQILQGPAFLAAVRKVSLYSAVRLHCNLNP
jgi:hypothetical protein